MDSRLFDSIKDVIEDYILDELHQRGASETAIDNMLSDIDNVISQSLWDSISSLAEETIERVEELEGEIYETSKEEDEEDYSD